MHAAATERFSIDNLTGRRFDQWRPSQENSALIANNYRLIAHGRNVSTAGRTGTHYDSDLRDILCRQARLVIEDAAKVLLVRKHLFLQR